jgi:hypothetical protein
MKRLAMLAAGGLIAMLPNIASARPHFFFGFNFPVPPIPFAVFAPPPVCVTPVVVAPQVVVADQPCVTPEVVAPAPVCVAPTVVYVPAPTWRYSYYYAPHYYYHYTYPAPVRGYGRYHYR